MAMIGIQVVAWPAQLGAAPATAWIGPDGGDIGRSSSCKVPLPDPERHISRRHAAVVQRQGRYYLQSLSAGLPLTVDGAALLAGAEAPLEAGMRITLGEYVLQVLDEPESLGGASRPAPATPPAPPPPPGPPAPPMPPPRPAAPARAVAPPQPPPPESLVPEVDLLVGETGDALTPPAPPPARQPVPAAAPPPARQPVPAAARPLAAAAAAPGADDLAAALVQGLGLPPALAAGIGAEQAQRLGALLRAMTRGTLELLTARMVAKRELGAAATQLRTRENNPLKFLPDVDTVLAHLLGPAERGFLEPQAAVQEAFDDLRAHQVALLAGMRAALDSVMSRFDPAALEQRLAPGGALENLIPANRRARLWSAYGDEYARIVGEIEDDFDALLGRAFLKAYQAQLQAMK